MTSDRTPSLAEAISRYYTKINEEERRNVQQELNRFIQWCGKDRGVDELTPPEVAEYAESAGMWGADSVQKLKPVKSFLTYLKKNGITRVGLASHLKISKSKRERRRVYLKSEVVHAELSRSGLASLQSRLELLKEERIKIVGDIGRAMADKDFKENAPLDAAKERQGLIESSIRDLEGILIGAVVADEHQTGDKHRVRIGSKVTVKEAASGKKHYYTVVDSRETDPATGKISNISPVGKSLMDKVIGEEVHISIPSGTLHYIIQKVK